MKLCRNVPRVASKVAGLRASNIVFCPGQEPALAKEGALGALIMHYVRFTEAVDEGFVVSSEDLGIEVAEVKSL